MLGDDACFESLFFDYKTDSVIALESDSEILRISPNFQNKSLVISEQTNSIDSTNNLQFSFKQKHKKSFESSISFNNVDGNKIEYNLTLTDSSIVESLKSNLSNVEFIAGLKNSQYFNKFIDNLSKILADIQKSKNLQQQVRKFTQNIENLKFVGRNKILVQQKYLQHSIDFRLLGQGFQVYILAQDTLN